jgi:hypothetical protein
VAGGAPRLTRVYDGYFAYYKETELFAATADASLKLRWTATHVRTPDRWLRERILPPRHKPLAEDEYGPEYTEPLEPGTYSPGQESWQRSGCDGKPP